MAAFCLFDLDGLYIDNIPSLVELISLLLDQLEPL